MAGNAKPDNVGIEGEINLIKYSLGGYDDLPSLIDGKLIYHINSTGIILFNNGYIEFELLQQSNIWAYGIPYSDGGGKAPQSISLYKKNESGNFILILDNIATKQSEWYKLLSNLSPGIYRVVGPTRYAVFTEWYVELIAIFLLQEGNNIYTTDGSILSKIGTIPYNADQFKNYGINLSNINSNIISFIDNDKYNIALLK